MKVTTLEKGRRVKYCAAACSMLLKVEKSEVIGKRFRNEGTDLQTFSKAV